VNKTNTSFSIGGVDNTVSTGVAALDLTVWNSLKITDTLSVVETAILKVVTQTLSLKTVPLCSPSNLMVTSSSDAIDWLTLRL